MVRHVPWYHGVIETARPQMHYLGVPGTRWQVPPGWTPSNKSTDRTPQIDFNRKVEYRVPGVPVHTSLRQPVVSVDQDTTGTRYYHVPVVTVEGGT